MEEKFESEPKILFEFHQNETYLDEDYTNDIVIDEYGEIEVSQRSTFMYEPTTITKLKIAEEHFANDIKAVLEKNKDNIAQLPDKEWEDDFYIYRLKILDKKIDERWMDADSTEAMILIGIRLIIDYYYPGLIDWKYIFISRSLEKEYDEIIKTIKEITKE